ncbi:glycosyl transferase [Candidatus Woesebacteria bacterium RIFCSPHIGHO2_01_FULL_38_10]|uniref:Glycosyl transferase n=1 Tax=Candidatus Woesebacteria bacterium RIFCSPLOWO2_01_FULL_39_10b TaxID=1802517 RepID=A0A1F8B5H3_9BACT|nr:MAG: glycosyl transferase [Candidatus Woesebacteria bacterium RIFCSPHIGHO2_01_FULL_38_10]OGM59282.1 MAG: glycosyl transferase [Candidatus Woesebacteria bacterium RIFCSPLOWO2_01_FULL_39_10b]
MKLSIIIPVYNEEKTVGEVINRVKKEKLVSVEKEIVVVDDASSDRTAKILKKQKGIKLISHKVNKGKGSAVRNGIKNSSGDIVLIQDADLEYNPSDYARLLKPIVEGKTKVVYGSRLVNYPFRLFGKGKTPLITHYIGNKTLTFITNLLFGSSITDMETCYKVFKRVVLDDIEIKAKRFEFEPEITAKLLKAGERICEIPIEVKPRSYSDGKKISWRDGFIALWTLIKYRFVD